MKKATAGTWLTWLGALAMLYIAVPVVAFVVRLPAVEWDRAQAPDVWQALWISVYSASIATAVSVLLGVPLAYLLARGRGRWTRAFGVLVYLPLALPPLVSGVLLIFVVGPYTPLGQLFDGALTDSVTGIVLAQIFVASPFLIVAARSAFAALDPAAEDVAATLGHHGSARFLRVALPAAAPGIRAGIVLCWLRAFGEFGATAILAYNPHSLPVFVYVQFSGPGLPGTIVPVLLTLAAALAVVLVAERRGRRGPRRPAELAEPAVPRAVAGPVLDLSLTVRLGEFRLQIAHAAASPHLALLGASGAGKSAALRVLAGLQHPQEGHLTADGSDLLALPPERRDVGYLPQESTLLPHLRVAEQITFGVGADTGVAAYWARRLGVDELAGRYPSQLSGGQQRRVALVRALARSPRLLLVDEPSTGLDAPVRDELRRALRTLQRETGVATVLVTHDPEEAAMLADEVVVLRSGRVAQAGPQPRVFKHPNGPEVARLVGVRNIRRGRVRDGVLVDGSLRVRLPAAADGPVAWCIRPEEVVCGADQDGQRATVVDVLHLGALVELLVDAGGARLAAVVPAGRAAAVGDEVRVRLPAQAVTTWPADGDPEPEPPVVTEATGATGATEATEVAVHPHRGP